MIRAPAVSGVAGPASWRTHRAEVPRNDDDVTQQDVHELMQELELDVRPPHRVADIRRPDGTCVE